MEEKLVIRKKDTRIKDRGYYVAKANDLIRKTRYSLTAQQQKIILFAISKIKPDDPPWTKYEFSVEDLCHVCGLRCDAGGTYYRRIKEDLTKLTERTWCVLPDGSHKTVSWIGDATITPNSGTVSITFNPNMEPYLFDLRQRYTQYKLEKVLVFKSGHTIRLWEILRSYTTPMNLEYGKEVQQMIGVDELREMMGVEGYPKWADFHRYVIKKAVDEINECSDELHIEYDTIKVGRNVEQLIFYINTPRAKQLLSASQKKKERLNR